MLIHGGQFDKEVIDFSVNVNPVLTDTKMGDLLIRHQAEALRYPSIDGQELEKYIEAKEDIKEGCVYVGNGASDCLYQMAQVLRPETVLIIEPTFTEYRRAFELYGATVLPLQYDVDALYGAADPDDSDGLSLGCEKAESILLEQISKIKADMVVLCNPNNPTGHCYSNSFIEEAVAVQRVHKGYVFVDESFRFFQSVDSCYKKDAWNLIVLTSLTKYYGIPGLRIGYMTGNISLIQNMRKAQVPWSINGLALACTKDLLEDEELGEGTQTWYEAEKRYLENELEGLSFLEYLPSTANFYLCKLQEGITGFEVNTWLLDQAIPVAVRTCQDFIGLGDAYIRIGLRTHEENIRLLDSLKAFEGSLTEQTECAEKELA